MVWQLNTRPVAEPVSPNWLDFGATAFWDLQEPSGDFLDQGDNLWDVPIPATNFRIHTLFNDKAARQFNAAFGSAAYADARIVSEMSLALIMRQVTVGYAGIFCYSTGVTDALWGLGSTSGGQYAMFDKRHPSGSGVLRALTPLEFAVLYGAAAVLFMTRSATGVCKLFCNGKKVRETAAVAAPAIVGDEVIAIGGRHEFDHAGLWTYELPEQTVRAYTKRVMPLLPW